MTARTLSVSVPFVPRTVRLSSEQHIMFSLLQY